MPVIFANLLLLAMEARGLYISVSRRKWGIFIYYTQISNIVATIATVLLLAFGTNPAVTLIRYLGAVMLLMTAGVTVFVLIPLGGDPKSLLISGNGIYHHTLCPILYLILYIFTDSHPGPSAAMLPVAITMMYGFIMMYLNYIGKVDGPYPFFRVRNQSVKATVIWFCVLLAVICALSYALIFIAR